jgi:hypothetical protein
VNTTPNPHALRGVDVVKIKEKKMKKQCNIYYDTLNKEGNMLKGHIKLDVTFPITVKSKKKLEKQIMKEKNLLACYIDMDFIIPEPPISNDNTAHPPLGLRPQGFVIEERLKEVKDAIIRCRDVEKVIPFKWIKEYNELVKRRKK